MNSRYRLNGAEQSNFSRFLSEPYRRQQAGILALAAGYWSSYQMGTTAADDPEGAIEEFAGKLMNIQEVIDHLDRKKFPIYDKAALASKVDELARVALGATVPTQVIHR